MSSIPRGEPTAGGRRTVIAWWTGKRCRSRERVCAPGESRAAAGQLRTVPAPWADGTCGVGQDDARVVDAQLWSGGEGLSRSLRVEKSAVSDNFIASSREKLQALMERPLGELRLCAVLIDGTPFRDRQMIVALGINVDGRKNGVGSARRCHRECRRGQ